MFLRCSPLLVYQVDAEGGMGSLLGSYMFIYCIYDSIYGISIICYQRNKSQIVTSAVLQSNTIGNNIVLEQ